MVVFVVGLVVEKWDGVLLWFFVIVGVLVGGIGVFYFVVVLYYMIVKFVGLVEFVVIVMLLFMVGDIFKVIIVGLIIVVFYKVCL